MQQASYLIIGKSGMLARAWIELLDRNKIAHVDVDFPQFDLTKPETIKAGVTGEQKIVINCAAWTDVDGAETKEALASVVNGSGVGELARRCKEVGATLVHYSTDYVFNGIATVPYPVDASRAPIGAYGRTKAQGEEFIEKSGCKYLLLRTSWLYAPWAKNFVRTIAKAGKTRPVLKVVNDQRGRPTSAEHLAATSFKLINQNLTGTFHVTDGGECTWYEFAKEIVRLSGGTAQVNPCGSEEYPTPTKRPAYSVLDLSKTEKAVGPMPPWLVNLTDVINRLEPL